MPPAPTFLLLRRRYLGDVVLLGAVARNLRHHRPDARIYLLTEPAYAGLAPLQPELAGVLTFPRRAAEWPGFVRRLRALRATHALDFDNTERTALVTRLSGAPVRATFDRELIPHRWPRLYTHAAKVTNAFYDSHPIIETSSPCPPRSGCRWWNARHGWFPSPPTSPRPPASPAVPAPPIHAAPAACWCTQARGAPSASGPPNASPPSATACRTNWARRCSSPPGLGRNRWSMPSAARRAPTS